LFQYSFDELDFEILKKLKSKLKNVPIFLVRNKIDMEFEAYVKPYVSNRRLDDLDDEEINVLIDEYWHKFRGELIDYYFIKKSQILDLNENLYFVSSDPFYRKYFDFELLIKETVKSLSEEKSNYLLEAIQNKFKNVTNFLRGINWHF
jgi:GTPase SAR1 family protein